MKIKFYMLFAAVLIAQLLPAQDSGFIFTISKTENGKFNKKDILSVDDKYVAILNVSGMESLDLYDKNTLEYVKNIQIFKTESDGGKYSPEFYKEMNVKTVYNVDGTLYIFTHRVLKENKDKQIVVYCTVLDKNFQPTHYLKEIISAPYAKGKYGVIEIELDEVTGKILVFHQPETEPEQSLYIDTRVLDMQLNILSQGIIELPFKAVKKASKRYLIPVNYAFRNDRIYSYLHVAGYNEDDHYDPDEYIATIGISDPLTKKTQVIPLDFNNRKLYQIIAFFKEDQLMLFSLYQNTNPKNKNEDIWYNGFFTANINEETNSVEHIVFSEFTSRQISELTNSNNLLKKKEKEEDLKHERVNAYLSLHEIIYTKRGLILVAEFKHNYVTNGGSQNMPIYYDVSRRGSICLFRFNHEGQIEDMNTFERTDYYRTHSDHRGVENAFTKTVIFTFNSKKENTFNIFFPNTVLGVDVNTLEIQSHDLEIDITTPYKYTITKIKAFIDDSICYFMITKLGGISGEQYFIMGKIEN